MRSAIFWPVIALVVLVALVMARLYVARVAEIRARRIAPQTLATRRTAGAALENVTASDNLANLFEIPVLFFVLCLALAITDTVTLAQLVLAWLYVGLRALHSLIHLTYNRVLHRFAVFLASVSCLLTMWVLFAAALWRFG